MSIVAIVAPFTFGHPSHGSVADIACILAVALLVENMFILAYCRRSLRSRLPRQSLDRPSSLLFAAAPLAFLPVSVFAGFGRIGSWNGADVLSQVGIRDSSALESGLRGVEGLTGWVPKSCRSATRPSPAVR